MEHLPDPLHRHARARPEALALWAPGRSWSYAALDAAVAATADRLQADGIRRGERVALCLERSPEMIVLLWALWRLGAVAVPLSTRLPAAEVERHAQRVGCDCLIGPSEERGTPAPDSLKRRSPAEWVEEGGGSAEVVFEEESASDRPATIVFTSGSTGTPKAALHTWRNHCYSAKGSNANLPLREGDRWLLSLPLYHVGGLAILVRCALAGAAVALPAPQAPLADGLQVRGQWESVWGRTWALRRIYYDYVGPAGALERASLDAPGTDRLAPYHRLDLGLQGERSWRGVTVGLQLTLANALGRANPFDASLRAPDAPRPRLSRTLPGRRLVGVLTLRY